ncbi:MAG: helix-turn-helix domain-containing protein [Archangiaceae bacterium]|nr:helix-turn-helix domain-containing protein [Archangiaceae bacterium]
MQGDFGTDVRTGLRSSGRSLFTAPPPLLTVRQVAERLAVSTATVYALVGRGELEHARVSNAIRVSPEALERYLTRGRR